ncbi:MAG: Trk system potassium transporter TrkA [Treponema sp.]|jgi:trk system potassium uptake protein TrkA|nr:Trk system potassium transporter TrkA [Treponema sp.]
MRIIIVGAGMVGTQLARYLIQQKHDISLIEADEDRARYASNRLDCMVLQAPGNSIRTLKEAGAARADALVCVTDSDELNMITCGLAACYPNLLKIARVRNDEYVKQNLDEKALGIDHFVHPDIEAARSVMDAVEHGVIGDILSFTGTSYEFASFDIAAGTAFDGLVLKDFHNLIAGESLVTLVERKGESMLPAGSTTLLHGDRVHILAKEAELELCFKYAGRTEKPLRKVGIVGGGRVGALIAEGILNRERGLKKYFFSFIKSFIPRNTHRLFIIEKDSRLCKELAVRFPEAVILNEDISDESFITEERIDDLDLIITATEQQEVNIITTIYLKSRGVKRSIALVSGAGYAAIARQLGVDVVIPLNSVVVDSILSRLMGSGIKGVHRIGDGSIGILEIEISRGSQAEGKVLSGFRLPAGALVILVKRKDTSFIPRGDYEFTAGDQVILTVKNDKDMEIRRIFGVSP